MGSYINLDANTCAQAWRLPNFLREFATTAIKNIMPEGPELHLSSQFINSICKGRIFSGKVKRNPIHKCAEVCWDAAAYTISAVSRGKELKVFLQALKAEKDVKPKVD